MQFLIKTAKIQFKSSGQNPSLFYSSQFYFIDLDQLFLVHFLLISKSAIMKFR